MKKIIAFIKHVDDDDIVGVAAQTTFYLMFALFPLLLFVITLLGYLDLSVGKSELSLVLPEVVLTLIDHLPDSSSKTILIVPLIVATWSASGAVWALMRGIYLSVNGKRLRLTPRTRGLAFLFTLGLVVTTAIPIALSIVVKGWISHVGAAGIIFLFITALYTFTPGCQSIRKMRGIGSGLATILWIAVNFSFEKFSSVFFKINPLYSGVSAFLSAAIWMYAISFSILLGAEVNAQLSLDK